MEQQVGGKQDVSRQHQVVTKQQALRMLETYFGYTSFRPAQEAPIASLLRNEDVIGIMPTGAGKSICFQIPALCKAGLTIVFSPLISLMKDQVERSSIVHLHNLSLIRPCTKYVVVRLNSYILHQSG